MNLLKSATNLKNNKSLSSVLRCTAAGILLSGSAMPFSAFATNVSGDLAWVNALKSIYKTEANASPTKAAISTMNSGAMSNPLCVELIKSKEDAKKQYVQNKMPPDPTTVIQNSTCFLDVMKIAIPTSGIGFLDDFMGFLTPFLESTACDKTKVFWDDLKGNLKSGEFAAFKDMTFSAISTANSISTGAITYGSALSGIAATIAKPTGTTTATTGTSANTTPIVYQDGISAAEFLSLAGTMTGSTTTSSAGTSTGTSTNSTASTLATVTDLMKEIEDLRAKLGL